MINLSAMPSLLRPGNAAVFEDYNIYKQFWHDIYSTHASDKAVEYDVQTQSLGIAQLKRDGSPTTMGSMNQAFVTSYLNQYYSIGFQITRQAIKDNLYPTQFPQSNVSLRNSLETRKNVNAAFAFNNAFNANITIGDGQPLASLNHPISNGTLANTFNTVNDLSETAIEQAIAIIRRWTNQAALPINLTPQFLLVPPELAYEASRITNSSFRTNTPNNDISAIYHDKYLPRGFLTTPFLTSASNWSILTDEPHGFKYFLREPLEIDYITDQISQILTITALERYVFGVSNFRAGFFAQGLA